MDASLAKWDYPTSKLYESDDWLVLLRPKQVTLGALILIAKSGAPRFPELSIEALADLKPVTARVEAALRGLGADQINYLALMMKDKFVHFHVVPRYSQPINWQGVQFVDEGYPAAPNLTDVNELTDDVRLKLHQDLTSRLAA